MHVILSTLQGAANEGGILPPFMVAILVAAAAMLFVFYVKARAGRTDAGVPTAREQIARARSMIEAEEEVGSHMADMVELARRLAAQLDTKAARLEHLLERAEKTIEVLGSGSPRRAIASAERLLEEPALVLEAATPRESALIPPTIDSGTSEEIIRLAEEGCTAIEIAQRLEETTGKVELILALHRQAQRHCHS